tara:strand:- start:2147 stop:2683 length:537 start_codon:yes stop_codon:yes gene_type:complete
MKFKQMPFNIKNLNLKKFNLNKFNIKNFINMKNLKDLTSPKNNLELVLSLLFVLYLVFDIKTPNSLVSLVDNNLGNIAVLFIAFLILVCCNPILGILAFVVAYVFIKRSSSVNPDYAMNNYIPSEKKKTENLSKYNDFPNTLEEEIIAKMAPLNSHERTPEDSEYLPVLDSNINSTDI